MTVWIRSLELKSLARVDDLHSWPPQLATGLNRATRRVGSADKDPPFLLRIAHDSARDTAVDRTNPPRTGLGVRPDVRDHQEAAARRQVRAMQDKPEHRTDLVAWCLGGGSPLARRVRRRPRRPRREHGTLGFWFAAPFSSRDSEAHCHLERRRHLRSAQNHSAGRTIPSSASL